MDDRGENPQQQYPALSRLGLNTEDFSELTRQGFVSKERRGPRIISKLRFRRQGRQTVRSIADPSEVTAIQIELEQLQSQRLHCRNLASMERMARRLLADSKRSLEPFVRASGSRFHGRAIRFPRIKN